MKWLISVILVLIAGCVMVTVQMGEKNVAHRELELDMKSERDTTKRKELHP